MLLNFRLLEWIVHATPLRLQILTQKDPLATKMHIEGKILWHWHGFRRDLLIIYCWTLKLCCISSREDAQFPFAEEFWASKEVISHIQNWPELVLHLHRPEKWDICFFKIYSLSFKVQESGERMKSQMIEKLRDKWECGE